MLSVLRENPFLLGALTGSLAAYLLGLLVQYVSRPRKRLGFSVMGRRIADKVNPKLVIRYNDRDIERLHSFTIELQNIGNRALRDVPVTAHVGSPGEIVESDIVAPPGAGFTLNVEAPGLLRVRCDLLNKGEKATIGLTTVNAKGEKPSEIVAVTARQEDLECWKIYPSELAYTKDPALRLLYRLARFLVGGKAR